MIFADWLERWAEYKPDKVAVSLAGGERGYSYAALNAISKNLAKEWAPRFGLRSGDRLLIAADFYPEYFVLLGLAQKMGVILVPVNYRLAPAEIAFLVEDASPAMIIVEDKYLHLFSNVSDDFPKISWEALRDFSQENQIFSGSFRSKVMREEDPAMILYTSGTTGKPKGAIYTHGMMFWNSINTASRLQVRQEDRTLMVMPPFHTGGWNVLSTPFLHFGCSIVLLPKFDAGQCLQLLSEEQITLFMAVPTMVKMMAQHPEFAVCKLESLRYMIVGGEALPIDLIHAWAEKAVAIRQGYGLTEAGPNITSLEAEDCLRKRGSIGFPNFYVESKLIKEDGTEAGVYEKGELLLAGPVVTPGYWRNEEATKKAFSGRWFHTGDILIRDEEGYLYVVDRIKNMYISGGENVYPAEVEKCFQQHENVSEVAVVPIPDERWGEAGCAFIVLKNGKTSEAELLAFAKTKLAKFKVPREVVFMESLPKNDTGKIDRKQLSRE